MMANSLTLRSIVSLLKKELKVDVCSIYLLSEDANFLSLAATDGLNQGVLGSMLTINQGLTGKVARTRKPMIVSNPSEHPDYFHLAGSDEERYETYLGTPLVHSDHLLGVLTVQTISSKLFLLPDIQRVYDSRQSVIDLLKSLATTESKKLSA